MLGEPYLDLPLDGAGVNKHPLASLVFCYGVEER